MDRIDRIAAMEAAFDRARAALEAGETDLPEFRILADYLDNGEWLADYEADEAGLLPPGMKRGVLSQDGLYDLICCWEAELRKPVIHIFGASGSGTTTLGRALSERLGFVHMDSDDYFWLPTNPAYTTKRPIDERLSMMRRAVMAAEHGAVISGSLTGWGDPLIPRFTLALRLVTPTEVRIERLKAREYAHFGDRIREGGDMHQNHLEFLAWAAQYDTGDASMRSKACHDLWQQQLTCPLLTVDGTQPLDALVGQAVSAMTVQDEHEAAFPAKNADCTSPSA